MKKFLIGFLALATISVAVLGFASCQKSDTQSFDTAKNVTVISREDGSGTRGAFVELFKIEEKNADGEKVDNTIASADITNSTGVMMTSVAGNPYAIGYISLGSLNDTVKALNIDGAQASVENIKNGTYKVSRPFNIATKSNLSETASDFVKYIISVQGQKIVEDNGYIAAYDDAQEYSAGNISGKITISGSSSVTPVMEKLREAYLALNPQVTIELTETDSTSGMTDVANDVSDIGMASRELKGSETGQGLNPTKIAIDGIAVIVNKENTTTSLTSQQVKSIYTGEITKWSEVQ